MDAYVDIARSVADFRSNIYVSSSPMYARISPAGTPRAVGALPAVLILAKRFTLTRKRLQWVRCLPSYQTRRTITDGSTTLYSSSPNVREGGSTTGEDWVWLDMATDPPRHARLLNVFKVRDAGCPDLGDRTQRGQKGDIAPREAALETQLGDVYTHAGRYVRALTPFRLPTSPKRNWIFPVRGVSIVDYVRTVASASSCDGTGISSYDSANFGVITFLLRQPFSRRINAALKVFKC